MTDDELNAVIQRVADKTTAGHQSRFWGKIEILTELCEPDFEPELFAEILRRRGSIAVRERDEAYRVLREALSFLESYESEAPNFVRLRVMCDQVRFLLEHAP